VISSHGKAYLLKVNEVYQNSQLKTLLPSLDQSEEIVTCFELSEISQTLSIVLLTNQGRIKRLPASELNNLTTKRSRSIIKLKDDDQLKYASLAQNGEQLILATTNGRCLRFDINNELPIMGRTAQGKQAYSS
jgi:DNA gyrase subunit A